MAETTNSNEVWKTIYGFEVYEVSNKGNIRRSYGYSFLAPNGRYRAYAYTSSGRIGLGTFDTQAEALRARNDYAKKNKDVIEYKTINPSITRGYKFVQLKCNKKKRIVYVHRLVAETFIDNPNNYSIINHIDYDRFNNSVDNLEWCTQKHNVQHSICNMHNPKNKDSRRKGEKYISINSKGYYKVCVRLYGKRKYSMFKRIEDAIDYRDKSVMELMEYGKAQKNKSV